MGLIQNIKKELNKAKKSKISSWIDEESRKLDKAHRFFELAEKLGLVEDKKYIDGIPKGNEELVDEFYKLEDFLDYPNPQKIN
jgi:hypothetical protein